VGASFSSALNGDPKARQGQNFGSCTLAHFRRKNSEISPKIDDISSYAKILSAKKVENVRPRPPCKVHPRAFVSEKIMGQKPNVELAPML